MNFHMADPVLGVIYAQAEQFRDTSPEYVDTMVGLLGGLATGAAEVLADELTAAAETASAEGETFSVLDMLVDEPVSDVAKASIQSFEADMRKRLSDLAAFLMRQAAAARPGATNVVQAGRAPVRLAPSPVVAVEARL